MPVMNGLELLEKIKENDFDIPVIIMTGYAVIELTLKAFKLGAFDFLTGNRQQGGILGIHLRIISSDGDEIRGQENAVHVHVPGAFPLERRHQVKAFEPQESSQILHGLFRFDGDGHPFQG